MINLNTLFSSAAKAPGQIQPSSWLVSSLLTGPKPPRTESCSRDALFWFLVDRQIIDINGNIICEVPTEPPVLNASQMERLKSTLENRIPIYDRNGNKGFEISFNEIIGYVNEFYHNASRKPV